MQTYRSMEKIQSSEINLYTYDSLIFQQRCQDNSMVFSANGANITGYPHTKNECGPLPHTIYKMDQDQNIKAKTKEPWEEKYKCTSL